MAVVGVNGAGKSTLVKLMVGELEPDQGLIERHPNLRVAYVAQHAFAHIEDHLDMTPCEYVMWRYRGGSDKEMVKKDANTMTKEEMEALRKKAKEEKVRQTPCFPPCINVFLIYVPPLCIPLLSFFLVDTC